MRSFTSSRPVWSASSTRAPRPRRGVLGALAPGQLDHRVEPGADPPVLRALRARALQPIDLALDGVADGVGQLPRSAILARYSSTTSSSSPPSPSSLRMASQLLAQQELALRLLHAVGRPRCGSARPARARPAPPCPRHASSRRASTSTVSSSSTLRSTDRSGHQPAVSASAPGSSTPCSASASAARRASRRCRARRRGTRAPAPWPGRSPRPARRRARPRPTGRPVPRRRRRRRPGAGPRPPAPAAVGQLARVLDAGDGAHAGVAAVDLGDEQERRSPAASAPSRGVRRLLGLEGEGHHHLRAARRPVVRARRGRRGHPQSSHFGTGLRSSGFSSGSR